MNKPIDNISFSVYELNKYNKKVLKPNIVRAFLKEALLSANSIAVSRGRIIDDEGEIWQLILDPILEVSLPHRTVIHCILSFQEHLHGCFVYAKEHRYSQANLVKVD